MAVSSSLVLESTPTASQMNSYQGNANLGYGADGQSLDQGDKDISAVTINAVQQANAQNFQWQMKQRDQQIKDRDASLELFAQAKVAGDIDEVDRPRLQSIYDDLEKDFLDNPNVFNDPKAFAKIQGKIKEYNSLGALANTRAAEFAKQRLDISNTTDPELQKKKLAHLDSEMKKGVEHIPSPFMKELDWDPKNFTGSEKEVVRQTVGRDARGLPTVTETVRTNVKGIIDKYSPAAFLEGTNKTLPNEAAQRAKFILNSPQFTDPAYIVAANKKIDEVNKANGFVPGDKYYLTPFGVQGPDGHWSIETNPIELNKKVHVISEYNETTGPAKLDEEAQKLLVQQAEIRQKDAAAGASRANAAESGAKTKRINALLQGELDLQDAQIEKTKREGGDITSLTNQKIFAKVAGDAINAGADLTPQKYKATNVFDQSQLNTLGLTGTEIIRRVSPSNRSAIDMVSVEIEKDGKVTKKEAKAVYRIEDPANPGNFRLVGVEAFKKGGNILSTTDLNEGANKLASERLGNTTGFNNPTIQAGVSEYIQKFQSGAVEETETKEISITEDLNSQLRQSGNKIQVMVNGTWRNVKGKNSANNTIIYE